MASAGQAHAHSSQPMHFSSPSGHRLSWWWPWNRGAVGRFSSGYWTVSTFLNISWKVTPNPLTGLRRSLRKLATCDLPGGGVASDSDSVVVRQVPRRHREARRGLALLDGLGVFLRHHEPSGPRLGGTVPHPGQYQDEHDDQAEDHV